MSGLRAPVKKAAAALAAAGLLCAALYLARVFPFGEPDPARYPVRGIDVSHHQGKIDWTAAASDGVSFAFIKASEGGDYRDRRFGENWRGATAAGIKAGPYHFFTFCSDGSAQAANFLGAIEEASGPMLPPAVDLEFKGNCSRRPTPQELREQLLDFSDRVTRGLGAAPVFYVTSDFMRAYGDAMPPQADIWIRSVLLSPERTLGRGWRFWQYASRGAVRGVSGPVDRNVFNGLAGEWQSYLETRVARLAPETVSSPEAPAR